MKSIIILDAVDWDSRAASVSLLDPADADSRFAASQPGSYELAIIFTAASICRAELIRSPPGLLLMIANRHEDSARYQRFARNTKEARIVNTSCYRNFTPTGML